MDAVGDREEGGGRRGQKGEGEGQRRLKGLRDVTVARHSAAQHSTTQPSCGEAALRVCACVMLVCEE